ncbi:hypothetical protein Tco_1257382 [Tanacetum coccineum]
MFLCHSTTSDLGIHELKHELPSGLWLSFDFEDSHPDLPALYLRGGSIIPFGPAHQHVGEANPDDDLSLLVALDENGNDLWPLYSGLFDFSLLICKYNLLNCNLQCYLLTTYVAELRSSVITVRVSKTEGLWKRPNRRLHVHILLGEGAMVDEWGIDGEVMQIAMPSETEVSKLISSSKNNYKIRMEMAKLIPDVDKLSALSLTGIDVLVSPAEVKYGEWALKVVPWIGGRIISLEHIPTVQLDTFIYWTGIHWLRSRIEISGYEEYSGIEYRSADEPMSEWMLVDKCLGLGLLNKFSIDQVNKCLVTWDFGTANLELWSEERPVSKQSPLCISHTYEIRQL